MNFNNAFKHALNMSREVTTTNHMLSEETSRLQAMVKQFGLK